MFVMLRALEEGVVSRVWMEAWESLDMIGHQVAVAFLRDS